MTDSVKDPISVSIIGGSGYTGAELIRLISKHPHFQLNQVVANRNADKKIHKLKKIKAEQEKKKALREQRKRKLNS